MLQRLNQVRFQRILQKCGHCTLCVQVACRYRLLLGSFSICIAYDDPCKSLLEIGDIACQAEHCHDLGCYRDIVAVLSRHAVCLSAKTVYHVSKLSVVHVHAASPGDLARVDVQRVALEDVVVDHRCQQVVCRADRVEVTCKVKVDVLHRDYLCVSSACSSALYAEYRSEGRLTQRYHNLLADLCETVCQTYGGRGLSFACRRRVDRRYKDQLAVLGVRFL